MKNEHQVIYAFAHVEAWIEAYARSTNRSASELTQQVGTLLLAQGEGAQHSLPALRQPATQGGKAVGPLALDERAHRGPHRPLSGQVAYWAKMTPKQRKAEMVRRGMLGRKRDKRRRKV